MPKFRKRAIVIEAHQLPISPANGPTDEAHKAACWEFDSWCQRVGLNEFDIKKHGKIAIDTLEGKMLASPGDWIIKGIKGEFYPCRADIFEATYEAAPDDAICPDAFPGGPRGDLQLLHDG